eukprot:PRCOL_00006309-RA
MAEVTLDPAIRSWVLLPITFVMLLIGLLRHLVMQLTKAEPKVDADAAREAQTVARAARLRANGKNVHMIVPQMLTGAWVNFFFSGFSLDVTYVSSLSWYFLNLFGLRGLNQLLLGASASEAIDDTKLMGMQQQMMMGAGMDTSKAYAAELQQMELMRHSTAAMEGARATPRARRAACGREWAAFSAG